MANKKQIKTYKMPEVDYVECEVCDADNFISGEEFEKSFDKRFFCTATINCHYCDAEITVNIEP